jgi:hypothetical protein
MATPLALPADPPFAAWVWRAITPLRSLRRLLRISEEHAAVASAARDRDTSLTQAELEVLK